MVWCNPEKPDIFDLNELECRLLAQRIAFQNLMQAPSGGQLKIHGNIVNLSADVTNRVSMLSWLQSQTGTIKINLKKKVATQELSNVIKCTAKRTTMFVITIEQLVSGGPKNYKYLLNTDMQS